MPYSIVDNLFLTCGRVNFMKIVNISAAKSQARYFLCPMSCLANIFIIIFCLSLWMSKQRSKHQLKVSLIGNNGGPKPQIVKTNPSGTTLVQAESQFDKKERGKAFRQVVAAFIANIGTINTGLIFGFSAVVIPQLQAPSSLITIDENQASWIGEFNWKSIKLAIVAPFHSNNENSID